VYADWKEKGCLRRGTSSAASEAIDALMLKKKMKSGEVDVDVLNQCLRIDPNDGSDQQVENGHNASTPPSNPSTLPPLK